jgi:hypothetical protein
MIKVGVTTSHFATVLDGRFPNWSERLVDVLNPPRYKPYCCLGSVSEGTGSAGSKTVYQILEQFHQETMELFRQKAPDMLEALRSDLECMGRETYGEPNFETHISHAEDLFALHRQPPHGQLNGRSVVLPDFCYGFHIEGTLQPTTPDESESVGDPRQDMGIHCINGTQVLFYCHLCDTIGQIITQLLRDDKTLDLNSCKLWLTGKPKAVPAYLALRRATPTLPPLGSRRVLADAALRQALGKPIISFIIPDALWKPFPPAVKHFVLDAAMAVGSAECAPLFPDVPFENAQHQLSLRDTTFHETELRCDFQTFVKVMKKLGLRRLSLVKRFNLLKMAKQEGEKSMMKISSSELDSLGKEGEALREILMCILSEDIELSAKNKVLFELYPQHKRVLGLLEYSWDDRLRKLHPKQSFQRLWENAFTTLLKNDPDVIGKIEVKKGDKLENSPKLIEMGYVLPLSAWLESAAASQSKGKSGCHLSEILEVVIEKMCVKLGIPSSALTLVPGTPQHHAEQLAWISTGTIQAQKAVFFLGKFAIELRNFIEHGKDDPRDKFLEVTNPVAWNKRMGTLKKSAQQLKIHLPPHLAAASDILLLDAESLKRCLILMTLLLHGAETQLCFLEHGSRKKVVSAKEPESIFDDM